MPTQKTAPIATFPIELRIKAGRVPVRWEVRESHEPEVRDCTTGKVISKAKTERVFWPQVELSKWDDIEVSEIENPSELRAEIFRIANTNRSEEAALRFLNKVGAWQIDWDGNMDPKVHTWARGTFATITFGHRLGIHARVVPLSVDDLFRDVELWYKLIGRLPYPSKVKASFARPPSPDVRPHDRFLFAAEAGLLNTLQVSLEWHGKDPHAVIETLSGWELLVASGWADVVSRAEPQLCPKCKTRFTSERKRKFCPGPCAHSDAQRKYKRKKAAERLSSKVF